MARKFRTKLLAGAATVAFGIGTSIAGAQAQSVFDGFYGGVSAGYYHFNADNIQDDFIACCSMGTHSAGSHDGKGLNLGLFAGYGQTFAGNWYLGAEAEGSFNVHADTGGQAVNGCGSPEGLARVSANESFGASGRLGYLFTPAVLGYLRGGVQVTRFKAQYQELNCDSPNVSVSKFVVGARVGAGADVNVGTWAWMNEPIFLRIDYAHTFYQSFSAGQFGALACCGSEFGLGNQGHHTLKFDPSDDIIRVGFIIKLGGPPPAPPPVTQPAVAPAAAPPAQPHLFIVYFNFDKYDLTLDGSRVIHEAADYYRAHGNVSIKIDGYTDLAGTQAYNLELSKHRAQTVTQAMIKEGVPANVMATAWHGKQNPAVPTADGVREARNRRVEIYE